MYRFGCIIIIASLIFSATAFCSNSENQLSCRETEIFVSPAKMLGGEHVLQNFIVTIEKQGITKTYEYLANNDFLQIKCETKQDGSPVLLLNHFCGGSGCSESNYSIIDLITLDVLLTADERYMGNQTAAESILGKEIEPIICGINSVCYSVTYE